MATTPPPVPLTADAAYTAFKNAEGTLTADQANLASANSALAAAQSSQKSASDTVATDTANATGAAQALITTLQAYVASLNPAPATPATPTS